MSNFSRLRPVAFAIAIGGFLWLFDRVVGLPESAILPWLLLAVLWVAWLGVMWRRHGEIPPAGGGAPTGGDAAEKR